MIDFRTSRQQFLDDITCSRLQDFSDDGFDLLVRDVEFRDPEVEDEVDLLMANLDDRYLEAFGVYIDSFDGARVNPDPEIARAVQELGERWLFMYNSRAEKHSDIDSVEPLEGEIYFEDRREVEYHPEWDRFQDVMFGYDVLDAGYDLIDPADC